MRDWYTNKPLRTGKPLLATSTSSVNRGGSLRAFALIVLLAAIVSAVEEAGAVVVRVADGDTLTVRRADGTESPVRLLAIDTPESKGNSHGAAMPEGVAAARSLRELAPAGTQVRLWGPGATIETDRYNRLLAVVLVQASGWDSLNEQQVARGWSPYWRKYGALAESELDRRFTAAQAAAERAGVGAWATAPDYMRDKSNERTAPRR